MSERYLVFNGDADGLCAQHQWRLAYPGPARLITGAKRDIALLQHLLVAQNTEIFVFDIGLDQNHEALKQVLANGNRVRWFDHHEYTCSINHPNLRLHIHPLPEQNTSYIVYDYLGRSYPLWAAVGLYGDRMDETAKGLDGNETFKRLGRLLNYNAYGQQVRDLHIHPKQLAKWFMNLESPTLLLNSVIINRLEKTYQQDLEKALTYTQNDNIIILPNTDWAWRISGELAYELPKPNAVLVMNDDGGYRVSIRMAESQDSGAFCRQFETGGGRVSAGGINHLPCEQLKWFCERFHQVAEKPGEDMVLECLI